MGGAVRHLEEESLVLPDSNTLIGTQTGEVREQEQRLCKSLRWAPYSVRAVLEDLLHRRVTRQVKHCLVYEVRNTLEKTQQGCFAVIENAGF